MESKTPKILYPALRQYRHNLKTIEGFISGFDYTETLRIVTETLRIVIELTERIAELEADDESREAAYYACVQFGLEQAAKEMKGKVLVPVEDVQLLLDKIEGCTLKRRRVSDE